MRLKSIAYAVLPVTDQDTALDFYTNVVGLTERADVPTRDGPHFVVLGVDELVQENGRPTSRRNSTRVLI